MYKLDTRDKLSKKLEKIAKKNPKQLQILNKKILEILKNPYRFKKLKESLKHFRRIHIDKHFVLIFSIEEETKIVILEDFDHHDNVYK
ncbi:type II toxin-antitoxin system mRNA interferase toxin, RelE/StbE family [Candidatus Woesearchaeota archaeon]|nr:type II toxin-antitoxin system mRNA interferase toxin, RelE/StbE family [Candidatus Woesearchaeota archaeon]